mmetsp:Transcript_77949/g.216159  ORF Transcript_77949/g.216159 Transcript_77949/m.216159 type:complete len:221 (-) Transcript_77949:213-875(-)
MGVGADNAHGHCVQRPGAISIRAGLNDGRTPETKRRPSSKILPGQGHHADASTIAGYDLHQQSSSCCTMAMLRPRQLAVPTRPLRSLAPPTSRTHSRLLHTWPPAAVDDDKAPPQGLVHPAACRTQLLDVRLQALAMRRGHPHGTVAAQPQPALPMPTRGEGRGRRLRGEVHEREAGEAGVPVALRRVEEVVAAIHGPSLEQLLHCATCGDVVHHEGRRP